MRYDPIIREITPSLLSTEYLLTAGNERAGSESPSLPPPVEREPYRVGKGDVLAIIVYGHPDITNPGGSTQSTELAGRLVDMDGEAYVPFVGPLEVAGETIDAIRKNIAGGLARVIREPQVDVRVLQYRSQQVYVSGDISQPCEVAIRDIPLTIVRALSACQTLAGGGGDSGVTSVGVTAVHLVRGGQTYPINLSRLYGSGRGPVLLQDGDRLIVDDSFGRIFVIGQFNRQLAVPYSAGGSTLFDAISAAGGLNVASADASQIYVIRGFVKDQEASDEGLETNPQPLVYHLDADSAGALILANQFALQPRDVVYAAPASLVNFNRALATLTPTLDILFRSFLIYDRADN